MNTETIAAFAALAIGLFFVLVAAFQWLWNTTMPDVFGVGRVRYWQALRLLLIAGILFGGAAVG